MKSATPKKSVNIRVFKDTRDRLKIKSIRANLTLMDYLDRVSKLM